MQLKPLALVVPILLGLSAAQARATPFSIVPNYDSTWSADANAAADEAAITNYITNVYDARYTNPVTVSIDFSDISTGLGMSSTTFYTTDYNTYRNTLIIDKSLANGGDGNSAFLSNLPSNGNPVPGNGSAGIDLTSAQARAIGLGPSYVGDKAVEGVTTYDSQISLNVSAFPTTAALNATAAHEINEALGLSSALDGLDNASGTATVANVGSMDFFRYAAIGDNTTANPKPTSNRSFTSSSAAVSYFSDTGGSNPIVFFNQSATGDRHDWASNGEAFDGPVRVQDAFGPVDATPPMGPAEFQALNDVGYNSPAAAPEASQFTGMGIALLFLSFGLWRARKRRSQAPSA